MYELLNKWIAEGITSNPHDSAMKQNNSIWTLERTERSHIGQKSVFITLGGQVQPFVAS